MNAFVVLIQDPVMAFAAGSGNVVRIHGGLGIAARKLPVRSVAVCTGCGNSQSTLQQPLSVDTFGVVLNDVPLVPLIAHGCRGPSPMASGAEGRYFEHISRGLANHLLHGFRRV